MKQIKNPLKMKRFKIPLTPIGVLAHRLRTLDRSLVPPSAWAEIFRCTCLQSHLQTSPPTPQKSYPKFRNPRTTFENTPFCAPKYSIVRGIEGGPWISFLIGIVIFLWVRSPYKISEHIVSFLPYPLPESMGTDTSGSQSRISWLSCFLSCSNYYFFQLCSFQILIKFILSHSHARVVKEGKLLVREQVEKTVVRKQTW